MYPEARPDEDLLGYDVAYCGGDFYSALYNGLFSGADPDLLAEFRPLLNCFGLFDTTGHIPAYVRRFKEEAQSESNSEFCVYRLSMTQT